MSRRTDFRMIPSIPEELNPETVRFYAARIAREQAAEKEREKEREQTAEKKAKKKP